MHAAITLGKRDLARLLVNELGTDVNRPTPGRCSILPVFAAAFSRNKDMLKYLVEEPGASTAAVDIDGDTVLLHSARYYGRLDSVKHMLEHGDASITETNNAAMTVWDLLTAHMRQSAEVGASNAYTYPKDPKAMTALLRIMVLHGALPPELAAFLAPSSRQTRGGQGRTTAG